MYLVLLIKNSEIVSKVLKFSSDLAYKEAAKLISKNITGDLPMSTETEEEKQHLLTFLSHNKSPNLNVIITDIKI